MSETSRTSHKSGPKERRFLDALRDLFVGAKVDGESGYINLMRIKASYFTDLVEPALMEDIAAALEDFPNFREEMFDKLHAFFSRYFSRSGSICFAYTPNHFNVYEKVYTDEQDVVLFWKTHMLYYVKTDRLFNDLKVEVDDETFFFNCSKLEHKKTNEKRQLVYTFNKVEEDDTIHLAVTYSGNGQRVTKTDEIIKKLKDAKYLMKKSTVERAIRVFERQSEIDFFINKDAGNFLHEQFDLWMYQYMFKGETQWTTQQIRKIQAIRGIAVKLIDFIAQFEDELVRIWNKPKFIRNSRYVVTLDRLAGKEGGIDVIAALTKHKGMIDQIAEWNSLGIVKKGFDPKTILKGTGKKRTLVDDWKFLSVDTKYFANLELKLIDLFDDLDEELDGRLIMSDNYQALNTLQRKFQGKVKCCYIDPPYNAKSSEILYINDYKGSSWLTFMENRLQLTEGLLAEDGVLEVAIDENEESSLGKLLERKFASHEITPVSVVHNPRGIQGDNFSFSHETIYFVIPLDKKIITHRNIPENEWEYSTFRNWGGESDRFSAANCFYPVLVKGGKIVAIGDVPDDDYHPESRVVPKQDGTLEVWPIDKEGTERKWRYSKEGVEKILNRLRVKGKAQDIDIEMPRTTDRRKTVWKSPLYDSSTHGTRLLGDMLGKKYKKIKEDMFPKSIHAVKECIEAASPLEESHGKYILDYFGGTGTTAHATMLANQDGGNRKFLLIEVGDHIETVCVPRLKKMAWAEQWKDGYPKDINGKSLFFKVSSLEQYEDTLSTAAYSGEHDNLFHNTRQDLYSQYVFLPDEKLSRALDLNSEENEVNVDLTRLYPDIDLAESLSCITGKWIKRITKDEVEFADGSKESLIKPNWKLLKPLIFWGATK